MWCCYQTMKQTNCWCQKCCIWSWYDQMYWRLNVMSDMLHSTSKRSDEKQLMFKLLHSIAMKLNADWRLFEKIVETASDVDVIKCIDDCFDVRETASDFERSNALTRLSVMSDDCIRCWCIRCTGEVVWLLNCCIWPWNNQMHAGGCLEKLSELHLMPMSSDARWRLSDCQGCTRCRCHRMHWQSCLIIRLLHPTVKRPEARWWLSIAKVRCNQLIATSFAIKLRKRKFVNQTFFAMKCSRLHPMSKSSSALTILSIFPKCWGLNGGLMTQTRRLMLAEVVLNCMRLFGGSTRDRDRFRLCDFSIVYIRWAGSSVAISSKFRETDYCSQITINQW